MTEALKKTLQSALREIERAEQHDRRVKKAATLEERALGRARVKIRHGKLHGRVQVVNRYRRKAS